VVSLGLLADQAQLLDEVAFLQQAGCFRIKGQHVHEGRQVVKHVWCRRNSTVRQTVDDPLKDAICQKC